MAKTIKFNLICNNEPIRTIEDLRENFVIEDILNYYRNGLLERWLKVRGYTEVLEQVAKISDEDSMGIITQLIKIFKVESNEEEIQRNIYILDYVTEQRELNSIYDEQSSNTKSIIDDYLTGYENLVDDIKNNPDDIAKIKASLAIIATDYKKILDYTNRSLYMTLKDVSIIAIMCLLMNEELRKYYLPVECIDSEGNKYWDTQNDKDKLEMYHQICSMVDNGDLEENLKGTLCTFAGTTDSYWKDLKEKDRKYMIIKINANDYVRSAGKSGEELGSVEINHKFVILDGIDYKSNSARNQLWYMEV